ncbi:DUF1542 domain-containing protein [Parvimonas sp. G1425]|uniref:DUF1542 domain-containing protein n=1 Tax=Parvimonas sp. G1425 TaxID=3387694 RepID=UPI0039E2487D
MKKKRIVSAVCLATMISTTSVYSTTAAEKSTVPMDSRATNVSKASDNDDQKALKAKEEAKKELTVYANSIIDKVNSDSSLTTEEKKVAVDKLKKALERAINQVNILHTHKYVDLIKREMKQKIDEASIVKNKIKDESKKTIDEELKKRIKIINEVDESTNEEKGIAIEKAKKEAEKAKINIDNAKTNAEVQKAKNDGVAEIHHSNPESKIKENARKAIDAVAKSKIENFTADTNATEDERQKAIRNVDEEVRIAKVAIENARTKKEVEDIKNKFIEKIKNININQKSVKEDAKKELTDYAEKSKSKINSDSTLIDEEKKVAVEKVEDILKKALNQIDNIAQDNFIDTVKQKVKEDIDKAGIIENKAKDVAKNSIDKAIQKQIEKINSEKDSTKEEKDESINKLNARVMKAKMTIDNATTAKAVENAKNDGIKNIELIKAETKIKKLLKKAVEDKDETIKMDAFKNANKEKQDAYLKAIEEGQKILDEPMATKKDVEDANKSIEIAKKSLDGKAMGQDKGKDKDKAKDKDNGKIKDKSKDNGNSKDKAKDNGSTKDKDKAKEQNRPNDSNKSKGSKVSNTQKKSKSKLPKTSYSNGIVAYGISILASAFGAFSIRKKKKED